MTDSYFDKNLLCFALCIDEFIICISSYYSIREKELHFGKSWNYAPLRENEVIISTSLADSANTHIGDPITLSINISRILSEIDSSQLNMIVSSYNVNLTQML